MTPYDEGFRARRQGKDATQNPYRAISEPWLDWADGWKDLDEHLRDRDAALSYTLNWFGSSPKSKSH